MPIKYLRDIQTAGVSELSDWDLLIDKSLSGSRFMHKQQSINTQWVSGDCPLSPTQLKMTEPYLSNLNWAWTNPQVPRGDVVEPGEGYGGATVESGGGDANLAGGGVAGGARGDGLRHDGDLIPREQAACVPASPSPDITIHEGRGLGVLICC